MAVSLAARNLFQAQKLGHDLMVMCAGCAKNLRVAANQLRNDETSRRINREILGDSLGPDLHIYHLLDILPNRLKANAYQDALQKPLNGLRYVPYYGCLLATPPELRDYPKLHGSMEAVMHWLGADVCNWGYQAKCCGAFLSVARPDIVGPMVTEIMDEAISVGAECVVTACAMCALNLELRSHKNRRLPVFSIVELLSYGLGAADFQGCLKKHLIDPFPLFHNKNFAV